VGRNDYRAPLRAGKFAEIAARGAYRIKDE
jgi:hypothetical protein